ncbi:MAG TPA: 6-phosphogluconolactonase [Polyangiaceae bacterium]
MTARVVCETTELPTVAAAKIADALVRAITERGHAAIALAGGTTPRAVYQELAKSVGINWAALDVYFGDERAVPANHPDSNYRMAEEALLGRVPFTAERIHRMRAESPDRAEAAREYDALLPDALDVIVLGIGEDGHTASLFPGSAALSELKRRVVPVIGPKPPPERLTITPPVIQAARECLMLASGAGKAGPVARALLGPSDPLSCPSVLARQGIWILDHAAAGELNRL